MPLATFVTLPVVLYGTPTRDACIDVTMAIVEYACDPAPGVAEWDVQYRIRDSATSPPPPSDHGLVGKPHIARAKARPRQELTNADAHVCAQPSTHIRKDTSQYL